MKQNNYVRDWSNHCMYFFSIQYFDLAADVLAENAHLTYKCLSPYLWDFIDAQITQQTSPEEVSCMFLLHTHVRS